MVISTTQERKSSEYSLARIHELAKKGRIASGSRKVNNDILNLGYSVQDVCECLHNLRPQQYYKSEKHNDIWHDVYKCKWSTPNLSENHYDDLYIKLKLDRDCVTVIISSFHLS